MDVLLDTHAAIWFFAGDERLSKPATEIIENLENTIYISIIIFQIAERRLPELLSSDQTDSPTQNENAAAYVR